MIEKKRINEGGAWTVGSSVSWLMQAYPSQKFESQLKKEKEKEKAHI